MPRKKGDNVVDLAAERRARTPVADDEPVVILDDDTDDELVIDAATAAPFLTRMVRKMFDGDRGGVDIEIAIDEAGLYLSGSTSDLPGTIGGVDEVAEALRFIAARIEKERDDAALHPDGRCTCAGEGKCLWCRTTGNV